MDADVLFAGIPVDNFMAARAWYERFFGRPPDVVAHGNEVMWQVVAHAWLYIVRDRTHAGNGIATVAVPDIEQARAVLAARGVTVGAIEAEGDAGRKMVLSDPDGNSISIIEVVAGD